MVIDSKLIIFRLEWKQEVNRNRKLKESTIIEFSSGDISERIGDLYKKVNITQFAEEHGLARKTLYKMKEKGIIPRGLLMLLCEEAKVNPVLVEYSPKERFFYFSCLSEYVKSSKVEELYSEHINLAKESGDTSLLSSIQFVHKMMVEGDLTLHKYEQRVNEILKENKHVK